MRKTFKKSLKRNRLSLRDLHILYLIFCILHTCTHLHMYVGPHSITKVSTALIFLLHSFKYRRLRGISDSCDVSNRKFDYNFIIYDHNDNASTHAYNQLRNKLETAFLIY